MSLIDKRPLSRVLASPSTYGTLLTRVALAFIIIFSSIAITLFVVVLGIDQLYTLRNEYNVFYTPSDSTTTKAGTLLLPQFDATVGLITACVGESCFGRAGRSGVQGLIASTLGAQTLPAGPATTLQRQLESEFLFGYDSARSCGTLERKLRYVASFGYAAYAISLFFFTGVCITSILFCLLVGGTDVLAGTPSLDKDSNAINVNDLGVPGVYLMYKLKSHLTHEIPLLVSTLVFSGLALVFSICSMGVTIAVQLSSSKCGKSACDSFRASMKAFFEELAASDIAVSEAPTYSCRSGVSFPISIVGVVLAALCVLLSCVIFAWFTCTHRRQEMLGLRDQLFRLAEVQGLVGTIAGGGTPFPLAQSRQVSGVVSTGSMALSMGGLERDAAGNIVAYRRGASNGSAGAAANPRAVAFTATHYEGGCKSRTVGARIGLYRMMKQFMSSEDLARQTVAAQEQVEFYSLLAMREVSWHNEEMRMLHQFTLDWFVGPPLDLCVLETNARQLIIEEFNAFESDFLKRIATGFEAQGEPTQAWERSGPLPVAESARWQQQVARWEQMQAAMAPLVRQTASYARAVTPPSPRKAKRKAPPVLAELPALDTDRWIAILDRLRASAYDDGAFVTRSASPLLMRRATSTMANFDDNGSVSSNVFSNPSFVPVSCDDLIPVDHVRAHLVRSTYLTKTAPRPPPRLRALPQVDDKKGANGGKSGAGRRRRSTGGGGGSMGVIVPPRGRSPSPRLRSPGMASLHNGDESNFFPNGSGEKGEQAHAAPRPFSSRDGTTSGRSPFQSAFDARNSTSPHSPNGRVRVGSIGGSTATSPASVAIPDRGAASRATPTQDSGVQPSTSPTQSATFPTGSAWRFQRPG